MEFDFAKIAPIDRYKILTGVVVPRPIAWVSTVGGDGTVNVAPFSFFNAMGSSPAIVALGIGHRKAGEPKDTLRNIGERKEFVVNLVTYAAREAMNLTSADFPADESELDAAGLETRPSLTVAPPRLAVSPVHFECRLAQIVAIGWTRVVLGEVVHAAIDDEFFDPERGYVATDRLDLIGRMHGTGWYARTTDLFEMPRATVDAAARIRTSKADPPVQ